eukprot:299907_1
MATCLTSHTDPKFDFTTPCVSWKGGKGHIKDKFILLVEAYSKGAMTPLPPEMMDIILLYYAKPLQMKLQMQHLALFHHYYYCPVEGTYGSMIKDIKIIFNQIKVLGIEHKNIEINKENWVVLEWDANEPFYISDACQWISVVDPTSGRTYYANMTTRQTSWTPPPGWISNSNPGS